MYLSLKEDTLSYPQKEIVNIKYTHESFRV